MSESAVTSSTAMLADTVFERLKREIVEARLEPEAILVERALAERFEVSKGPVREALKRLSGAGFVRPVPRVGYIVSTVSVRDLDDVFVMRIALEPLAVELAAPRLTDPELGALEELARATITVGERPSPGRAVVAQQNSEFHRAIAHASGNARLDRTIGGLVDELERVMHLLAVSSELDFVLRQHLTLVDSLRGREPQMSAQVMRDQLVRDHEVMRELATRTHCAAVLSTSR